MSFSKAKIQRFNEINADCTPSPAKYNVSAQEKVKLGIIPKSERFTKKSSSPPHSETASVHSTPCFQTPTVPTKKKRLLGMSFKGTKSVDYSEELREKMVECCNKDSYIRDLTDQIEEMTGRINRLKQENSRLLGDNSEKEAAMVELQKQKNEVSQKCVKEFSLINTNLKDVSREMHQIRREYEELKCENFVELSKVLEHVGKFQELYNKTVEVSREEFLQLEAKIREMREKEDSVLQKHLEEVTALKKQHCEETEEMRKNLEESEAKVRLLEENFKDVNLLMELHMKEKVEEIEASWKQKLEDKEKEHDAILKECQAISEYSIIQSEVEKNQIKKNLEEKEEFCAEIEAKHAKLKEELRALKTEKHAYDVSIATFRDTIEVLKKRLFDSDRDVEQLKEELEKCEEKILTFEKKCSDLTLQLTEMQNANEELEMQYESTSKIMQNQVEAVEKKLLGKVELLKKELQQLLKDRDLLNQILEQHHDQQHLIGQAQDAIIKSNSVIESLESKQVELETELKTYKHKLEEEIEEGAEIRKKYIEKSGKYDELAQQFEQLLQELDKAKGKIQELENLIGPYQEQLEAYQSDLKLITSEKSSIANEAKELGLKYADILGHQNHNQKIKHVKDLSMKSCELFQKNLDLESKNFKLNKALEKLMKEIDDLKKPGRKLKVGGEDKENLASPKSVKGIQSPGPLKDKN